MEVAKLSFAQELSYRSNTFFMLLRGAIRVLILVSIWKALYQGNNEIGGITLSSMITYMLISVITRSMVATSIADTLASRISSGSIVVDMIKPYQLGLYLFFNQLGMNLYSTLFSTLPVCIIFAWIYGVVPPANFLLLLLSLGSFALGIVLMFLIDYVLGLLTFWLKNGLYIEFVRGALFEIFSGFFIPLWFYPKFLQTMSMHLPFRYVLFEPIALYLGKTPTENAVEIIGIQCLWIAGFFLLAAWVWKAAQRIVTVQGG